MCDYVSRAFSPHNAGVLLKTQIWQPRKGKLWYLGLAAEYKLPVSYVLWEWNTRTGKEAVTSEYEEWVE